MIDDSTATVGTGTQTRHMAWPEKHLNWTWVLSHIVAIALDSLIAIPVLVNDPYETEVSTWLWMEYGLHFSYLFTVVPATFYVLHKKGRNLAWFFLSGLTFAPLWLSNKNDLTHWQDPGIQSTQGVSDEGGVGHEANDGGNVDTQVLPEIAVLTERKGRSYFREQPQSWFERDTAYTGPATGPQDIFLTVESLLDKPHVLVDVDSPSTYCKVCGTPMQLRMARYSGYDPEAGVPRYRLVRACPKASFYTLFGLVWQTDLRRHTVQGPTQTKLVLAAALLAVAAIFIVVAVSHIGGY